MDKTLAHWGHNIRLRRTALDLTTDELAELVGVHRSNVVRWEAGRTEPRREHKQRLAGVLSTDVGILFPLDRTESVS